MKIRIAAIAFAMCALFVIGCAGTPVAVDRYGNVQPDVQIYQTPRDYGTVTEFETRPFDLRANETSSSIFGFNSLQINQVLMTLPYSLDSSTTLFNFKGYWSNQMPWTINLPYNQDWSLTLFNFENFRIKIMPMTDGRF